MTGSLSTETLILKQYGMTQPRFASAVIIDNRIHAVDFRYILRSHPKRFTISDIVVLDITYVFLVQKQNLPNLFFKLVYQILQYAI